MHVVEVTSWAGPHDRIAMRGGRMGQGAVNVSGLADRKWPKRSFSFSFSFPFPFSFSFLFSFLFIFRFQIGIQILL
jgi:hypothetical protein